MSPAEPLLASSGPLEAIAIAASPAGARALIATDAHTLVEIPLGVDGAVGPANESPFPFARSLFAAERWGERLVAFGAGPCEHDQAATCLHVRVDAEEVSVPLASPIERIRIASSPELLVVGRSHRDGPAQADVFRFKGGALRHEAHTVEADAVPAALHHEILAATVSGDRFALAVRAGAVEDSASALLLMTPAGTFSSHALEHAASIDAIAFDPARPGALLALASYEFHRPYVHRVSLKGVELEDPRLVPFEAPVGAPFTPDPIVRLSADTAGLSLLRRTRAGDSVGEPTLVSAEPRERAALGSVGDLHLVALTRSEPPYGALLYRVRCD